MGTLLASALIGSARRILQDPAPGVNWTDADLLAALNQIERNACTLRPEIYTTIGAIPMVAGIVQTIPAGATALFKLLYNAGSKRICSQVDNTLDELDPYWPAATPELDVQEYILDPRERTRFLTIPPNNGSGSVVAHYGLLPTAIAAVGNVINLHDQYELPLIHGLLSEAYAMNTIRQDVTKATFYRSSFERQLGGNAQSLATLTSQPGGS